MENEGTPHPWNFNWFRELLERADSTPSPLGVVTDDVVEGLLQEIYAHLRAEDRKNGRTDSDGEGGRY